MESKSDKDLAKVLAGLEAKERHALAKQLKAALGNKTQKTVRLADFTPKTTTLFERGEAVRFAGLMLGIGGESGSRCSYFCSYFGPKSVGFLSFPGW